jgi:hypothetical protein
MTHQFKVGQRVRCVDASGVRGLLTVGQNYDVKAINVDRLEGIRVICDDATESPFHISRFVPADTEKAELGVERRWWKCVKPGCDASHVGIVFNNRKIVDYSINEAKSHVEADWIECNAAGEPPPPPAQVQAEATEYHENPITGVLEKRAERRRLREENATLRRELAESQAIIKQSLDYLESITESTEKIFPADIPVEILNAVKLRDSRLALSQDRLKVLEDALRPIMDWFPNCAQLLDRWHCDVAWSPWDTEVRKKLTDLQAEAAQALKR